MAAGLKRYFTGLPCGRGHVAERQCVNYLCVECMRINQRADYERDGHEYRARASASYRANPDKVKRRANQWSREHKAYTRSRSAKARATLGIGWQIYQQLLRLSDPEKYSRKNRAGKNLRRARMKAVDGAHTAKDIATIYKKQKGKCACCRNKLTAYHVDHVMPLARNGSNDAENLQLLCPDCNLSKGAKDPLEFMQSRGFLL